MFQGVLGLLLDRGNCLVISRAHLNPEGVEETCADGYLPEGEGGPPGSDGYWKFKEPGSKWQRYDIQGNPLSPENAHPNPPPEKTGPMPPPVVPWWMKVGVGISLYLHSEPAY